MKNKVNYSFELRQSGLQETLLAEIVLLRLSGWQVLLSD